MTDRHLAVVMGKPGVGKTTIASHLAAKTGAEHINTDAIRNAAFDEPTYDPDETQAVYRALEAFARAALERGSVVLDGTFSATALRNYAESVVTGKNIELTWLRVTCDEAVAKERLRERDGGPSDAGPSVYDKVRMRPPEDESDDVLVIDTTNGGVA